MTDNLNLTQLREVAENAGEAWSDAEHVDIFTPPTVLGLIERVQAAEAKLERVRAVCESDAFECNTREWGNLEAVATDDVLRALDGGDQT